jgi:hypothetical protein
MPIANLSSANSITKERIMKRFLILAALIGGMSLASLPSDAMAGRWDRGYRRGYNDASFRGYRRVYRPRYYGYPRVIVQAPGVQVGYGNGYYGNAYYSNGYYSNYGW